jgi:hypothetical protein
MSTGMMRALCSVLIDESMARIGLEICSVGIENYFLESGSLW